MVWDEDFNIAKETEVFGETISNARKSTCGRQRTHHCVFSMGLCRIKMVQGNKLANSNANPFPALCPVPCYSPVSSSIPAQSCFSLLATWLKKYQHQVVPCCLSIILWSACHGQPSLLAVGLLFALKSQAVQQGSNPGNLTVKRLLSPHEKHALWPGFHLHMRGVPCPQTCFGACTEHKITELCLPSSCKNVAYSSLPRDAVCPKSVLSSSTQLLTHFQPIKGR